MSPPLFFYVFSSIRKQTKGLGPMSKALKVKRAPFGLPVNGQCQKTKCQPPAIMPLSTLPDRLLLAVQS